MGARSRKMRGRGKAQEAARAEEGAEVKKEEKQEGRYNVDFQELNEELSGIDLKEEEPRVPEADEPSCGGDVCIEEGGVAGEKINVQRITNEDRFRIDEGSGEPKDGARPLTAYPMTPNVLTAVVPQTPRRRVLHEEGSNLVVRDEGKVVPSKMVINRYPGQLFVQIDQVERFMASRKDVSGVSIRIESRIVSYETRVYRVGADIGINEMVKVPIGRAETSGVPLRFVLLLHHKSGTVTKSCEAVLMVDVGKIHSIHNNLLESTLVWDNYVSRNLLKSIRSFFTSGAPEAWGLKTYLSFVSDDELRLIPAPVPQDLRSLSKWLVVKRFSYNIWFKGFVNLRGDIGGACTNLWKRRYVRCYGYMIFVFNEHSRSLVGTINLVEASFDAGTSNKVYLENFLSICVGQGVVELHFDTKEKYKTCRGALTTMLPKTLFRRV